MDVMREALPRVSRLSRLNAANMRDETACLSVTNVDVLDLGLIENSCDCRLGRSVIYFLAGGHPSIAPVAFEHERQRTKRIWESISRRICRARGFVDEDRSRGRVCIEPVEWIVGEQESILFGDFECSQALTAWAGAACNFDVSWMTVLRGFASIARSR